MNRINVHPALRFKGQEFILILEAGREGGAITTHELYENFAPSFAHLYPDGTIRRFGKIIGTRQDIEWVVKSEIE